MPPKKIKHDWSWVEDVNGVEEITDEHRLKAAGLNDVVPCTYIYPAIDGDPLPVKEKKCNIGYCYTNPACYNYVGVKELLDPEGKGKYVEDKSHNRTTSRKEGMPAGLRNLGATCYVGLVSGRREYPFYRNMADNLGKRLPPAVVPQHPLPKCHKRMLPSRRLAPISSGTYLRIPSIYRETICRSNGFDRVAEAEQGGTAGCGRVLETVSGHDYQ
jgi:hypothetical protein